MYVIDYYNYQAQVCTSDEEFIRDLDKEQLSKPLGIAVSDGVVYVSDSNSGVCMFTLTG